MRHNRFIAGIVLAALLLVAGMPCALATDDDAVNDAFFLRESLSLTQLMRTLVGSETYVQMMTSSQEMLDLADEIAAYDYAAPSRVMLFRLDSDRLLQMVAMMAEMDEISPIDLPEDALAYVQQRVVSSVPSMINGRGGTTMLALSSMASAGRTYVQPAVPIQSTVVCLFFEDTPYITMTTFVQSGDETISASASFATAESLGDDLMEGFAGLSLEEGLQMAALGVTIVEYSAEEVQSLLDL